MLYSLKRTELLFFNSILYTYKITGVAALQNKAAFTCRNDTIITIWEKGSQVKSKFEKKEGIYSFRIGYSTYKKKL